MNIKEKIIQIVNLSNSMIKNIVNIDICLNYSNNITVENLKEAVTHIQEFSDDIKSYNISIQIKIGNYEDSDKLWKSSQFIFHGDLNGDKVDLSYISPNSNIERFSSCKSSFNDSLNKEFNHNKYDFENLKRSIQYIIDLEKLLWDNSKNVKNFLESSNSIFIKYEIDNEDYL